MYRMCIHCKHMQEQEHVLKLIDDNNFMYFCIKFVLCLLVDCNFTLLKLIDALIRGRSRS